MSLPTTLLATTDAVVIPAVVAPGVVAMLPSPTMNLLAVRVLTRSLTLEDVVEDAPVVALGEILMVEDSPVVALEEILTVEYALVDALVVEIPMVGDALEGIVGIKCSATKSLDGATCESSIAYKAVGK